MSAFSMEEREWFFHSYMGEFWLDTVRALAAALGEESALSYLAPRMKGFGMSLALDLKQELGIGEGEEGAMTAMGMVNAGLSQEVTPTIHSDHAIVTIYSCPFKDASPSVCVLVSAFLDGLCGSFGPEPESSFERGREGQPCHRTLLFGIKDDAPPADHSSRTALSKLKERLARGEISAEQYSQLRELILK
jgi:hypothetical protein